MNNVNNVNKVDESLVLRDISPLGTALFDALGDGVLIVGPGRTIVHANAVARGDALRLGVEVADLPHPERYAELLDGNGSVLDQTASSYAAAMEAGVIAANRLVGVRRGELVTWLDVSAHPVLAPGEASPMAVVMVYRDVTERHEALMALADSESHFRLLAENSTDVVQRFSADGVCLYTSPALSEALGIDPAAMLGTVGPQRLHPDDRETHRAAMSALVRTQRPQVFRYRMQHADGRWLWLESSARVVPSFDGRVGEFQTATRDVTARVKAEERLARLALTDPLTGLANRVSLVQRVNDLLAADRGLAVLFLDLDSFKVVNDSLGHSAGDEVLRVLAGRLVGVCRDGDLVARLGGDEFVVAGQGLDEDGALHLTERVQAVLATPILVAGHELVVSASIGIVTTAAGDQITAEQVLQGADVSMYGAKARGRAHAVLWTEQLGERAKRRLGLEAELRAALAGNQLVVHYQPQVDLRTGRVLGVEALVRWQHPDRGLLLPGEFLRTAEDAGLMAEIGERVMRAAAGRVARWRSIRGCEDLVLAVNVSPQELALPRSADRTLNLLQQAGLPPRAVVLEVVESVLLDAEGLVLACLAEHAAAGIRLALDDFGTGASSMVLVRNLPVDVLKIDRTFVRGLGVSGVDEAIVRSMHLLSVDLGMECVAEGVETELQRDWLLGQGIVGVQGFLLHRPMSSDAIGELLGLSGPRR